MTYTVPTNPDGSFVDMTLQGEYYKDLYKTAKLDIAYTELMFIMVMIKKG